MIVKRVLAVAAVVVALPYVRAPLYRFPTPTVFAGLSFINPYAAAHGNWKRANLHAHGRAWNGFTNGRQSADEIVQTYHKLGYPIAGVSDYQRIAALDGVNTIPLYEHGYNLGKRHQLAIGARGVEWFDFPFWQSPSDQQFIIDHVKAQADLVALAHPSSRDAYSLDDLQQLTRYDLLEVVNGPFVMEDAWDSALSTGHLVWALANDDTHDLNDPRRTAVAWNMIDAATGSTADVVEALKAGRTFAMMRTDDDPSPVDAVVPDVAFDGTTLTVSVREPAQFLFVGQDGVVKASFKHRLQASYRLAGIDTYVRTVIRSARTATFVNPVVRYDGQHVVEPAASVDASATWMMRGGYVLAATVGLLAVFRRRRPATEDALASPGLPDVAGRRRA
jgi:hypothetical protein